MTRRCTCGDCGLCIGAALDLVGTLDAIVGGKPLPVAPRGGCCDDEPCARCQHSIDRREEARTGFPPGWSRRDLDDLGDALAAGDWAGRGM